MTLTVGEHSAPARITEETPQGTHSIAGVGAPPFPLAKLPLRLPLADATFDSTLSAGRPL